MDKNSFIREEACGFKLFIVFVSCFFLEGGGVNFQFRYKSNVKDSTTSCWVYVPSSGKW